VGMQNSSQNGNLLVKSVKIFLDLPPKNGEIALWSNTSVVKCKYHVSQKKKMGSIISTSGTIFDLLLYFNSRLGYYGLKNSFHTQ